MKSFLSIAVPVALLMGGVALIAFMTQNTARAPLPTIEHAETITTEGDPITFDDDTIDLDPKPMEVEYPSHPHKDFWFHTNQERDALVGLWMKSCGCADVKVGTFGISQSEYEEVAAAPTPAALCRLMDTVSFEPMPEVKRNQHATIKATPAGRLPMPYIMRVHWEVKKSPAEAPNAERLRIEVNASLRDGVPTTFAREVLYQIVPASGFWPGNVDLGDISPGGSGSRDCIVWSPTRDRLNISVRVTAPVDGNASEPCAEISTPVKLTEQELAELPKRSPELLKIVPRSAYKFRVNLHERRGENQLEMGPLIRRLIVKFHTGPGEEDLKDVRPSVSAIVRGEVSVLNGDDVGRVRLGTFKFDRPRTMEVRLGSTDPKLELEIESCSHDKMHVKLGEPVAVEGRREWVMRIDVEASAMLGDFAQSVVLRVKGAAGRRLRIPVMGYAARDK